MDKTEYISLVISTHDMFFFPMPILTPDMSMFGVFLLIIVFPYFNGGFCLFFWHLITFCFFCPSVTMRKQVTEALKPPKWALKQVPPVSQARVPHVAWVRNNV